MAKLLSKMLINGNIAVATTKDDNTKIVVFIDKGKAYAVPLVGRPGKTGAIRNMAYVDPDDDDAEGEGLFPLVNEVLPGLGKTDWCKITSPSVQLAKAPEHEHTCTGLIVEKGAKVPAGAKEFLESKGYTFVEGSTGLARRTFDYASRMAEDEELRKIYEATKAEQMKFGINLASFPKNVQEEYKAANRALETGAANAVFLVGPAGTGKTELYYMWCTEHGVGGLRTVCSYGTREDHIMAALMPDEKGGWKKEVVAVLRAYTKGTPHMLDEAFTLNPSTAAITNGILDGKNEIEFEGVVYKRHPDFILFLAGNPGYRGTLPYPEAGKSRTVVIHVPKLEKKDFSRRLVARSKGMGHALSEAFYNALFDLANVIQTKAGSFQEGIDFSPREAMTFTAAILSKKCTMEEFEAALRMSYFNKLSMDHNNSERLKTFLGEEHVVADVKKLYSLYDFSEVGTMEPIGSLSDYMSEIEEEVEDVPYDEHKDAASDVDDLIGGLESDPMV